MYSPTHRIAPAITALLVLAACQDHPLAVTDEHQLPEADRWETVVA